MTEFAWLVSHEAYQPEDLIDQAVLAERSGFDAVAAADHFHPWVDDVSAAGFVWTWLGAAAERTTTLKLFTSVTCPLFHYHPALIAQASATVDRLSDGRFTLGVGTGENINEGPMGFDFPDYRERIGRMREAIHIIRELLTGAKVDLDGQYYTVKKAKLYSPPLSVVPIWMAAGGPQSARFAGRYADGVITSVKDPVGTLENVVAPFQSVREHQGAMVATRWVVFAEDADEAWKALAPMRGLRAPGRLEAIDPTVLRIAADKIGAAEIVSQYRVARTISELVDAYSPLVTELGADIVCIQVASMDPRKTIEMIGSQVLPELRRLQAAS